MSWRVRGSAFGEYIFRIAALVVVAVTVPAFAVAATDHGVSVTEATNSHVGVLDGDNTVQRKDGHSRWLANPATSVWAALGRHRAGHQQEQLYPAESPRRAGSRVAAAPSLEPNRSTEDDFFDYVQMALGGLAGLAIAAAAGPLVGRRLRRPSLEAALGSGDAGDAPRAAGLLGDLFVRQSHARAAEHAYRAAIDVDHPYWSPVAQVALAQLLTDRGDREGAQTLLEAVIASGHPRTAPMAQASLDNLLASTCPGSAVAPSPMAYERLGDSTSAGRGSLRGSGHRRE